MELVTIKTDDYFLILMESLLIFFGIVALLIALKVRTRYPKLTSGGWLEICAGLGSFILHAIFDVLDTMKWDINEFSDWLNVFDGFFFVLSILLIAYGVWKIANYGAELWGLE